MKPEDLPLESEIIEILKVHGISEFYPPQSEALPYVLKEENVVLSIPTASGKSLVAYIAIINKLLKEGGKALYIVPLKALAREKYEELKLFERMGLRVGISTGDLDDSDPRLTYFDIIVCTSEKTDSLLRHKVTWINEVKVIVIDEIHLIHDPSRGPTLEVIISHFRYLNPKIQIIALSATIKNATELSIWLNGRLIESEWRPVPLKEGVYYNNEIKIDSGKKVRFNFKRKKPIENLLEDSIMNNGQVLVFVNTRRSTVSLANKLGNIIEEYLSVQDKKKIKNLLSKTKKDLSEITSFDDNLFNCLQRGIAFHNAGLSSNHRRLVEQGFKNRVIKCIVATPTLAAGVNIPAQRVIIRDLWRYDPNFGMYPIPVLEYKQQAGRAGRPRFDKFGEAITIAKSETQMEEIFLRYIIGDNEPIYSKLGSQSALRMHLLASIATGFTDSVENIYKFIDRTFFAHQSEAINLRNEIDNSIDFLIKNGFVEKINDDALISTLFGKRTSALYIDPLSALQLKMALEESCNKKPISIAFLHAVCSTPDVRSLYLRSSDNWLEEKVEKLRGSFLLKVPKLSTEEYEWFLSDFKTASLIEDWINEIPEEGIIKRFNVGPGDIHNIVDTVQWLLHAAREFARMYNYECVSDIGKLGERVKYGCKNELLNLVSLKGIGRVRARSLYSEGFTTIGEIRGIPVKRLAKIKSIGEAVARNIKKQIEGESRIEEKEISEFNK
jgi:helicase